MLRKGISTVSQKRSSKELVVIHKEKEGILKAMLTEAEKLLVMGMVILMGILFKMARTNLCRICETKEKNLHLKDGIVKQYAYRTKIFGITMSSQRPTTISKEEGTDDCSNNYQEERINDRNQDAKDKVESFESSEKYAKLMGLNEEESIEWVARQKDKPSGDREIRDFL